MQDLHRIEQGWIDSAQGWVRLVEFQNGKAHNIYRVSEAWTKKLRFVHLYSEHLVLTSWQGNEELPKWLTIA